MGCYEICMASCIITHKVCWVILKAVINGALMSSWASLKYSLDCSQITSQNVEGIKQVFFGAPALSEFCATDILRKSIRAGKAFILSFKTLLRHYGQGLKQFLLQVWQR